MKKINLIKVLLLLLVSAMSVKSFAGKRYWLNNAAANWNTTGNWSTSSGGASGASVPGVNDTAYFDSNGKGDCSLDANISIKRIEMLSGYDSTFRQNGFTITLGTTGGTFSGGTFTGGSVSMTSSGAVVVSGCAFTTTTGTLTCSGSFTLSSGSFTQGSGTISFVAATFSGGTFTGGSGNITSSGTVTISGCAFTSTSGIFTSGGAFTFSSGSFTHNSGIVRFTNTCTITGNITFYNLKLDATSAAKTYTIASGNTLQVDSSLYFTGNNSITVNTGTIDAKKNVYLTSSAGTGGGSATLKFTGSGSQTLSGPANFQDYLPNVDINKTDTLHLANKIRVAGNWTRTAGVVDGGSSTVTFINTKTITGSQTLNKVYIQATAAATVTIAASTTLTVVSDFKILNNGGTGFAITINTGSIDAKGDIYLANDVTGGGGSATINIVGTGTQTIYGSTTAGNSPLPGVNINKASGTLYFSDYVNVAGNWAHTTGTISQGTSIIYFSGTNTISTSDSLKTVTFHTGTHTISSGKTIIVDSLLTIAGSTINTGTINARANLVIGSVATTGGGNATLNINGTGNQSLTGNSTTGNDRLPNTVINKSAGTLSVTNTVSIGGNFTYT
ncbi:MAG: hypothetical protein IAF38_03530, partial [Bacteroidia bacterium]|nr:hypothetical protein [Bacteroidia bacterium]